MIFNMEGRAAKERKKERKYDGGGTTDADVFSESRCAMIYKYELRLYISYDDVDKIRNGLNHMANLFMMCVCVCVY